MIIDLILNIIHSFFSFILSGFDIISTARITEILSFPYILKFFQIIGYIIPWANILPLIIITFIILNFKIAVRFIKTIWQLLPFV